MLAFYIIIFLNNLLRLSGHLNSPFHLQCHLTYASLCQSPRVVAKLSGNAPPQVARYALVDLIKSKQYEIGTLERDESIRLIRLLDRITSHPEQETAADLRLEFLGALAFTAKSELPTWWKLSLTNTTGALRSFKEPNLFYIKNDIYKFRSTDRFILNDRGLVFDADKPITVPFTAINHVEKLAEASVKYIAFRRINSNLCAFSLYSPGGYAFPLAVYDSNKNKVMWTQMVWANASNGGTGSPYHYVEIVTGKETICVVGLTPHCIYSETFNILNGDPSIKVSSSLWGLRDP